MSFFKKLLILWLVLLGSYVNIYAQTSRLKDSLRIVFRKAKQDTSTVNALMEYGKAMIEESVDSATFYYQKSFSLSKKLNFKPGIYRYYLNYTYMVGIRNSNTKDALRLAKELEAFAQKEKSNKFLSGAYFIHAITFQQSEQYDSSIYYYEKTLKLFEKINNTADITTVYGNISNIYRSQNMLDLAMEYNTKALNVDIKLKDTLNIISDYVNRSNIYYDKKDIAGEEKCNRKALKLAELIKSPYRIMVCTTNLASMFDNRQMYDSSIFYHERAYQLSEKYGAPINNLEILLAISHAYMKKKKYVQATKYLQLAITKYDTKQLPLERQLYLTELKINLFNAVGRYKEAASLLQNYNILTDSTNVISTQEKVLEFNNKLKKAESEKVILSKEVEINKQKTWLYLLSISGIALLLLGFLFYRYQNKKQEAKSQQIKLLEQENEFVAVKSSLEGQLNERVRISKEIHDDLGSSLTTISLLTEVLKTKIDGAKVPEVAKISATSARMVDSMNEIVWALNVHNDTLDSLVAFIRKYARDFLQDTPIKLVFEEDVNQDFTLQGNVRRSIYLVVKEAINNVVKHADAQQVHLNIQVENNKLIIHIEDDGNGINVNKKSVFSNGLRNMKQRMEDIGGTFTMYQTKGMVVSIEYNF
jgi:signal transduction histidine kinase